MSTPAETRHTTHMRPFAYKRTKLLLVGHSKVEVIAAIQAAFQCHHHCKASIDVLLRI